MKLHEKMRSLRIEKGITQAELGKLVFVTEQAISQYESGKREIKADMLERLALALGVEVAILEREEDREAYGLFWELSHYHDHINAYGKICADFQGAAEISNEQFEALSVALEEENWEKASKMLEKASRNIPGRGDIWPDFAWMEFLEASKPKPAENGIEFETTQIGDEVGEYLEGSRFCAKQTTISEIRAFDRVFNRMAVY